MKRSTPALAFLASALVALACKSAPPPALPSPSPTPAPTPRPVLALELDAEEGPFRVLDDSQIGLALFGEDSYGDWQMLAYFTDEGATLLKKATEENIDRMMRVLLGAELLLEARIMAPIEDGRMLLTGLSAEEADVLKAILAEKAKGD